MKNQTRGFLFVPVLLLLLAACGDDGSRSGPDIASTSGSDPRAQIVQILATPDRLDRIEQLIAALKAYPADQSATIGEILHDPKISIQNLERVLMVAGWSRLDPAAATEFAINGEGPGPVRNEEVVESVAAWARVDPHAVVEKFDIRIVTNSVPNAILALTEGWFQSGQDEKGLEQYIAEMGKSDARDRAIATLVHLRVARDGVEKTKGWALLLIQDADYKSQVYGRLAGEMTYVDPAMAVAWCDEICDTVLGTQTMDYMITEWANHSPREALDYLAEQDPTNVENHSRMRAAFRRFYKSDYQAAMEWVRAKSDQQKMMPLYQGPVSMYINLRQVYEPLEAVEWTDYLIDESERELTLITIARRWLKRDPEAAEAWLAVSTLSDEAKAEAHGPPVRRGVSQRKKK